MSEQLAQFPLGSCLLPLSALPLQVFEPRYRSLVDDVLAGSGEFGVTLIERGWEVGGGEVRTSVGTVARITDHQRLDDGRILLQAVGGEVFDVVQWLDDDPYPRAEIVRRELDTEPVAADELQELEEITDQTAALLALLSGQPPEDLAEQLAQRLGSLSLDPAVVAQRIWALGNIVPWGAYDRHRLLVEQTRRGRIGILRGEVPSLLAVARTQDREDWE